MNAVADAEVDRADAGSTTRSTTSPSRCGPDGARHQSLRDAARIELGLRAFLEDGGFKGFTDTFEDLHGLKQLPGLAAQRLMADGYGFGAEGDWKTAALVRAMKVMAAGLKGGTSFMEDYTYHLRSRAASRCSARTCWRSARRSPASKPSLEIHPLGIGGKEDPVRLVFDAPHRPGGQRVDRRPGQPLPHDRQRGRRRCRPMEPLPKLPVARALWRARAEPADRGRRLDPRRRRASHRLQPGSDGRAPRRLRRDGRHRVLW